MAKRIPFAERTNGEKYISYRRRRNASIAGKWGCVIAPFGIVFGAKFNDYVKILDTFETVKLTIGCVLAIVVAAIAVFNEVRTSKETKHLAPAVGWGLALAFIWLFQIIINDLLLIVGSEFAGQCAAAGLKYYGTYAGNEAEEYKKLARQDNTLGKKRKKMTVKVYK